MKKMRKLVASALIAAMLFSLSSVTALAASDDAGLGTDSITTIEFNNADYTYTVSFSAGNHGTFGEVNGENLSLNGAAVASDKISVAEGKIVVSGLQANDTLTYEAQNLVTMKTTEDSKIYYAKGFRAAGQDNSLAKQTETIVVTKDAEYVAAYGILGDQVKYTVKYQKENGESLVADDVFYGNIGDKPIVAYKYINGYTPKTVAFTKTLDQNEAENVFIFVYDETVTQKTKDVVTEETYYNYVTVGGETIVVPGGGAASNVTGGGAGNAGAEANTEDTAGAGAETEAPVVDESQIVDLDDEETPLANIEVEADMENGGRNIGVYATIGSLALIILAVAAYVLSKKRKIEE